MFVDEVDIQIQAGDGGNGCMGFRREKFVPARRPGRRRRRPRRVGVSRRERAPEHARHLSLSSGVQGRARPARQGIELHRQRRRRPGARSAAGHGGVRVGSRWPDAAGRSHRDRRRLCSSRAADDGGRGNAAFATSTNRAPRRCEPGDPGESRTLRLRLKLLADVGLVGFPNAGKSTLIARISAARPKIADYPFTTLTPNLGVVQLKGDRSFVVADVPGLIVGAHLGHGLGTKFLAHLERTKVLVHVIDVSSASGRDPVEDFEIICRELESFAGSGDGAAESLASKPRIAAANKIDALDDPSRLKTAPTPHEEAQGDALSGLRGDRRGNSGVARSHVEGGGAGPIRRAPWMKLGLFGGTFDPVHCGHLDVARAAQVALGLDRVWLVPARVPPHRSAPLASASHRFAMAAIAVASEDAMQVSDIEMDTPGASYTIETLDRLSAIGIAPAAVHLVTGADAFRDVPTWKGYPHLLDRCHFVVVSRPGNPAPALREALPALRERMVEPSWQSAARPSIFLVDVPTAAVSSTDVRRAIRDGDSLTGLVPPAVAAHIARHQLYTTASHAVPQSSRTTA